MANALIKFDPTTPLGQELRAALAEQMSAYQRLTKLAATLTQADAATAPAVLEVGGAAGDLFGVSAGHGAAFVSDLNGLAAALTNANRASLARLYRG